jgi:TetR/AcrR family transcriptional regulator
VAEVTASDLAAAFADGIRRFVRFAAEHPEPAQIMVHEGTVASDRLIWISETHIKPFFDAIGFAWRTLREAGQAAGIDSDVLYYLLVGAASQPYVTASEVRLLAGRDPRDPEWIDAHAEALVAFLLPGLSRNDRTTR